MSILRKLMSFFTGPAISPQGSALDLAVRCARCGEIIHTRIDLANDLSADYDAAGTARYFCRKLLIGEGAGGLRCFQRIEVELYFDAAKQPVGSEIRGGEIVDG